MSAEPLASSPNRLLPWALRGLWVAMPFTVGPALASWWDGASGPVRAVGTIMLGAGWAVGVVSTAVRHPVTLTALRLLAPAAVACAVATAVVSARAGRTSEAALAIVWSIVAAAWSFAPAVGTGWVNGLAYPNERRYLLRAPGGLLAGPLALAWALAAAGTAAGPSLLAARQWLAGGLALAAGVPLAVVLVRAMHNLSRRWLVFVPAGVVVHDPLSLLDPVLLPRQSLSGIGPAAVGTDALDLGQGAPGLALEVRLRAPVTFLTLSPGKREGRQASTDRFLVTPTRPGAVLEEARRRRLPVGVPANG